MKTKPSNASQFLASFLWSLLWPACAALAAATPDFESVVAPLLIKRCVECHQGKDPSGGLLLTGQNGLLTGGESGKVIDPEHPEKSYLLQRLVEGEMPPEKQGRSQKLPDTEIDLIRQWLAGGAPWPENRQLDYFERSNDVRAGRDWWSLQPVVRPAVPQLKKQPQPAHPIDAFIRTKLESEEITPSPPADRRTLIRRVYYDLIGLPPTEDEIKAFVSETDPEAWPKLIDRLLKMPQYGERWGRYWLDLARYADTSGYERDQEKPFAWKYRDWVVAAFNNDMPFEQFIIEQLAGDEIPNRSEQSVIATGFLRLGTWNDEPNDAADYQYERLEDLVHTTSSAFLALTVKCARCHGHKFDAITQEDYYRMASAFWAGPIPPGRSKGPLGGPTDDELGFREILGWTDVSPTPPALRLLKNGERHHPMDEVIPASLSSIPALERRFEPPPTNAKTTQRRLQLARWIADPANPLTARVLVNRLWQHHFGKAIVRTPNNFGFMADPPTHPQLLDWLAAEFLARGGRIKTMHRLILTSQTWRQSAIHPDAETLEQRDAGNRLWWRAERQRLDAETLRDSLLAASGELNLALGGKGFKPTFSPEALEGWSRKNDWQPSAPHAQQRRSLYMYVKRGLLPPMMMTFDLCDPTQTCGKRDVTIVPTQALALLNNRFVHDRSQYLATTIARNEPSLEQQINLAWSNVLKRQPSDRERQRAIAHVRAQLKRFSHPAPTPSPDDTAPSTAEINASLVLHLRADRAVVTHDDKARVETVPDLSGASHDARQTHAAARPALRQEGFGGKPTLVFDGKGQFLRINGNLLERPDCTIICVINDDNASGHREVISNWDGAAGNSTTSLFLGLTAENTVRFSDAMSAAGTVVERTKPFVLSAVNGSGGAAVYQNGRLLKKGSYVTNRRLDTPWVIGTQGNINGEFWKGGMAEIRVYDRGLSSEERQTIESALARRYDLTLSPGKDQTPLPPETLALASLCHVLMNSNEFLYVD